MIAVEYIASTSFLLHFINEGSHLEIGSVIIETKDVADLRNGSDTDYTLQRQVRHVHEIVLCELWCKSSHSGDQKRIEN